MKTVKVSVISGVSELIEPLPPLPEALALNQFLEELYKNRFVERREVARRVRELLEGLEADREQRDRLLKLRERFCKEQEFYRALASLFEAAAAMPAKEDLALANYAVLRVLLAQCAPGWQSLDLEKKAEILALLYMALYHLKRYQETRHVRHIRSAATLAIDALNALEDALGKQVEPSES